MARAGLAARPRYYPRVRTRCTTARSKTGAGLRLVDPCRLPHAATEKMAARFVCFRFFILPVEQNLFTKDVPDEQKLTWFRDEFLRNRDFRTKEGPEYALRVTERSDDFVIGKLSKKRYYALHEKGADDIRDREIEDWPYLDFLADFRRGEQLVVIRFNSSVVRDLTTLGKVLTEMANQVMFNRGYATSFEPLVKPDSFWHEVERAEGVFAVKFKLKSPNLFGAASEANEALRELRNIFNNTEADITLKNEQGRLTLPHDAIETYRDYADRGGGSWSLTVRRGNSKRRIKSEDKAVRITVDIPDGADLGAILRDVLERFLRSA